MRCVVQIVLHDNEEEYKKEYSSAYLANTNLALFDIPVIFTEEDFDHIFTEYAGNNSTRNFSERRAKRMYFMEAFLKGSVTIEVLFEPETKHLAIFCPKLESVMYLVPMPSSRTFRVGTFFDFGINHTKMLAKQMKKCVPLTEDVKKLLFLG